MAWSIDMDDFSGTFCDAGKYPLLNRLNNALRVDNAAMSPSAAKSKHKKKNRYDFYYLLSLLRYTSMYHVI